MKKIGILNYIALIISVLIFCIDLIPNIYLNTSIKITIYVFSVLLSYINLKLKNRKAEEKQKEKNRKEFWIISFIIYGLLLISLLLLDSNYRGYTYYSGIKFLSKEHFEFYCNIKPFDTVYNFIIAIRDHMINTKAVLVNILGNIIAFAPCGIFIPLILKDKFSNIFKFIIIMIVIVFIMECIQFITMTGTFDVAPKKIWPVLITTFITSGVVEFVQLHIGRSFDVDDIILNVLGAIIVYGIMKVKIVEKIIQKIVE